MLFSSNFLKNSVENYNNAKNIEKFSSNNKSKNSNNTNGNKPSNIFFYTLVLIIAFIFFVLELFLLYYAISIAFYCSQSREERVINIVLACTFTLPYVLIKITFDECSKKYIKNGMKIE